ncbi:hypothetical protein ACHAWF_016314, partial [Thalassiosira exigua]
PRTYETVWERRDVHVPERGVVPKARGVRAWQPWSWQVASAACSMAHDCSDSIASAADGDRDESAANEMKRLTVSENQRQGEEEDASDAHKYDPFYVRYGFLYEAGVTVSLIHLVTAILGFDPDGGVMKALVERGITSPGEFVRLLAKDVDALAPLYKNSPDGAVRVREETRHKLQNLRRFLAHLDGEGRLTEDVCMSLKEKDFCEFRLLRLKAAVLVDPGQQRENTTATSIKALDRVLGKVLGIPAGSPLRKALVDAGMVTMSSITDVSSAKQLMQLTYEVPSYADLETKRANIPLGQRVALIHLWYLSAMVTHSRDSPKQLTDEEWQKLTRKLYREYCDEFRAELKKIVGNMLGLIDGYGDPEIFQPPPEIPECPLCFITLPYDVGKRAHMNCCETTICFGCLSNLAKFKRDASCPFCRKPINEKLNIGNLERRVASGDASATEHLGTLYLDGDEVAWDEQKGLELNHRAADLGSAQACDYLSHLYFVGDCGLEKNDAIGRYYLEQAARKGHTESQHRLAYIMLQEGNGVQARKHFLSSAKAGHEDSLKAVRDMTRVGATSKDEYLDALRAFQEVREREKSRGRKEWDEMLEKDVRFSQSMRRL